LIRVVNWGALRESAPVRTVYQAACSYAELQDHYLPIAQCGLCTLKSMCADVASHERMLMQGVLRASSFGKASQSNSSAATSRAWQALTINA
jgi:hypothetical protein